MLRTNKRQSVVIDPARQAGNRRRAIANLRKRLKAAQGEILPIIDSIPVSVSINNSVVANKATYSWDVSPQRLGEIELLIRNIMNKWFQTQQVQKPPVWFFDSFINDAVIPATATSINNIDLIAQGVVSPAQLQGLTIETILGSQQHMTAISSLYTRAFNEMQGFSGDTATDLARVLTNTIIAGQSPRQAQKEIRKRFDAADSRAERIARTEINRSYNVARAKTAQTVRDRLGIKVILMHRSSLVATTRKNHAARHGRTYTIEEQNEWWDSGSNRINCLCSVSEVVVDEQGRIRSRGLQKKLEEQREQWFSHGA